MQSTRIGLGDYFFMRTQEGVDSGLVIGSLWIEPSEDVGVDSQASCGLGREQFEPVTHDPADDVLGRSLRVPGGERGVPVSHGTNTRPIGLEIA